MDRDKMFEEILDVYSEHEKELQQQGKNLYWDTDKGIFGTSRMRAVYEFFKKIKLEKYKNFLDLGSGDGRIVLIASLFTKATGIEFDLKLHRKAEEIKRRLGLDCTFIKGDYMQQDISQYDIIFINPDKGFIWGLDNKLSLELKGELYVYNEVFQPNALKKGKKFWAMGSPIVKYTNE
jgi:hypothetical protein